jgi:oligopeptide/dipeptide ABC transporter ATP-binding protein
MSFSISQHKLNQTNNTKSNDVVTLRNVKLHYPIKEGVLQKIVGAVRAVDGVDLTIKRGQTLGLVGESGCGKTTLGQVIAGLIPATDGEIWLNLDETSQLEIKRLNEIPSEKWDKQDQENWNYLKSQHLLGAMTKQRHRIFRRNCQFVFQDAFSSLNPRQLVRDIVGRPLRVYGEASGNELEQKVIGLLERVGLGPEHMLRFPHQFSGGQRQRISIARALALNPDFVILDEPTSALDVSVQAQILNLLDELQKDLGLTYLFITHDLGVVQHMSDNLAVMYLGKFAELGPTNEVFNNPFHPYTRVLRDSNPSLEIDPGAGVGLRLSGTVPNSIYPPQGCRLHPRCPVAQPECGWEVDDFLQHLETNSPALFEKIERVERSNAFSVQLGMENEIDAVHLRNETQKINSPLGSALEIAEIKDKNVILRFREVQEIPLLQISTNRSSSCLLAGRTGGINSVIRK